MTSPDGDAPPLDLARLRHVEPPASLIPGVMLRLSETPPPSLWDWLRRRRPLRLRGSPLGIGLTAFAIAGLLLVIGVVVERSRQPGIAVSPVPPAQVPPAPGPLIVRFALRNPGAQRVALAGDFNGWTPDRNLLEDANGDGIFVANVPLGPGQHEYMFVVDGRWVTDPSADEHRPDGFGGQNALLRI